MKSTIGNWMFAVVTALGVVVLAAAHAAAAQYEDTFEEWDASWGQPHERMFVQEGSFVIKPDAGYYFSPINQGMIFEDADISLRTRQVEGSVYQGYGLVFWAESNEKYYVLLVNSNGSLAVLRFLGERVLTPVEWRECDALTKGLDEWNEVRVVTNDNQATIHVNGTEILSFNGQPPEGGGFVGMWCIAGEDQTCAYEYDFLRVE